MIAFAWVVKCAIVIFISVQAFGARNPVTISMLPLYYYSSPTTGCGPYLNSVGTTTTGTHPIIRNPLNKKSTSHSGPRIAANSYELVRIAENRRNSIPYPLKYQEFKKHFAWTDFL